MDSEGKMSPAFRTAYSFIVTTIQSPRRSEKWVCIPHTETGIEPKSPTLRRSDVDTGPLYKREPSGYNTNSVMEKNNLGAKLQKGVLSYEAHSHRGISLVVQTWMPKSPRKEVFRTEHLFFSVS